MSTLYYFDRNGLVEFIRYILHYSGENFEDIRYERNTWPIKDVKERLPYGQLPVYEEGDRTLNQSFAIARYVAGKAGLLPSDPWEQALLDAMVLNIYDFWNHARVFIMEKDPVKRQDIRKKLLNKTVDYYFARFEKELKKNNGHFAGKLTWADFVLVGIVESANLFLSVDEIEKDYPTIQLLVEKIRNLPGVKEYIAARGSYTL